MSESGEMTLGKMLTTQAQGLTLNARAPIQGIRMVAEVSRYSVEETNAEAH